MHSFFSRHWHRHPGASPFAYAGCGPSSRWRPEWGGEEFARAQRFASRRFDEDDVFGGVGLGVRRPLRFLSWRLELSAEQTTSLARILERLKLERAQASLDQRRAAAELADALEAGEFGRTQVSAAGERRAAAARRVEEAVAKALEELHALLDAEQRGQLAELLRTGTIRI
ncbi:MAG TPA: Spy/CpxP family protein refolding chaperone [Myxococcota bacterium]|nr:Spy/CpxP family protein refolding chaperone [Myxococcota bacterium]